ncbi:hypothetical protein [Sutterella wadsworthensis]
MTNSSPAHKFHSAEHSNYCCTLERSSGTEFKQNDKHSADMRCAF